MELYLGASSAGFRTADWRIGVHCIEGDGVVQDVQRGLALVESAGRNGNMEALHYLGCAYRDGTYLDKEIGKAENYLQKSARGKEPLACLALGDMYSTDRYGLYSPRKASKWYLRGADLGSQACMAKAAEMYSKGWLVKMDATKAKKWNDRYLEMDFRIYRYERER